MNNFAMREVDMSKCSKKVQLHRLREGYDYLSKEIERLKQRVIDLEYDLAVAKEKSSSQEQTIRFLTICMDMQKESSTVRVLDRDHYNYQGYVHLYKTQGYRISKTLRFENPSKYYEIWEKKEDEKKGEDS